MKVAFVGLGRMGSAIASNILKAGLTVSVWNRTPAKSEPLLSLGAAHSASPEDAVRHADIVLTSLMDDDSVREVMHASDGILAGLRPGKIHVCVTTISPHMADELTELHIGHGSFYVSGPVVGRPDAAQSGALTSYLAGHPGAIETAAAVAKTYSNVVKTIAGAASAANTIKLCVNYTAVAIMEVMSEVYAFAEKTGADPRIINDFYRAVFAHPAMKEYSDRILMREFDSQDGFALSAGMKDVKLILDSARRHAVPLDVCRIVEEKMTEAFRSGKSDLDWSAFTTVTRERAGLS